MAIQSAGVVTEGFRRTPTAASLRALTGDAGTVNGCVDSTSGMVNLAQYVRDDGDKDMVSPTRTSSISSILSTTSAHPELSGKSRPALLSCSINTLPYSFAMEAERPGSSLSVRYEDGYASDRTSTDSHLYPDTAVLARSSRYEALDTEESQMDKSLLEQPSQPEADQSWYSRHKTVILSVLSCITSIAIITAVVVRIVMARRGNGRTNTPAPKPSPAPGL